MKNSFVRLALVALFPLLAACPQNPLEDTVCTLEARSAVTVEIPAEFTSMGVAHERAGVYVVTLRKAGYRDWTRADVSVKRDECHVQTAVLRADLVPA